MGSEMCIRDSSGGGGGGDGGAVGSVGVSGFGCGGGDGNVGDGGGCGAVGGGGGCCSVLVLVVMLVVMDLVAYSVRCTIMDAYTQCHVVVLSACMRDAVYIHTLIPLTLRSFLTLIPSSFPRNRGHSF